MHRDLSAHIIVAHQALGSESVTESPRRVQVDNSNPLAGRAYAHLKTGQIELSKGNSEERQVPRKLALKSRFDNMHL